MSQKSRVQWLSLIQLSVLVFVIALTTLVGCGGDAACNVLRADAEFPFDVAATVLHPSNEDNLLVAQTFIVEKDMGLLEEFWIVLIDGVSDDAGLVRVTVRPLNGMGVPDPDEASSIITPIDVNTSTLPQFADADYIKFDVGEDPFREVVMGDEFGIVIEFIGRTTTNDTLPVASLLGVSGDPFAQGTGSEDNDDTGFVNSTDDYFFRTFVLSSS